MGESPRYVLEDFPLVPMGPVFLAAGRVYPIIVSGGF